MRHTCEHCHTIYDIPDQNIYGKKLKVRCSRCRGIMWVEGPGAEQTPPPLPAPEDMFYYVSRKAAIGPLPGPVLVELARCGEISGRTYVYGPRLGRWARVVETPQLKWLYDAIIAAEIFSTKARADVFERAALMSDNHGYFPDPTLKSGLVVLDADTQVRLHALARQNGLVKPRAKRRLPLMRMAAAAALALLLGAGLGAAAHWSGVGNRPVGVSLEAVHTPAHVAKL